jgi:hypothetical protein
LALRFAFDASQRDGDAAGLLTDSPLPVPALSAEAVGALRLDRSLRRLLAEPERFLGPDGVLGVTGFLSIADLLDGARTSFVDDVLGGLAEPFDVFVFPAARADDSAACPLRLPQLAVVAAVTGADAEAALMRMARTFATIANTERAQQHKGPFFVRARTGDGGGHGLVAEPRAWSGPGRAPIEQQLQPTLWFAHGRVAIATTPDAARAALLACAAQHASAAAAGDRFVVRGPALAALLADNRAVIELGRLLDEGESEAAVATSGAACAAD